LLLPEYGRRSGKQNNGCGAESKHLPVHTSFGQYNLPNPTMMPNVPAQAPGQWFSIVNRDACVRSP
jgi:hypothetical protein